ncbi:hypothetical protein C1645_824899 [Glomus cerebriforme]|uniref:Uncharacterized protein n=1 Tax=Glomus cerebriforme TaxID=658196 RepID=A0A397T2R6_9GLOM|nr:hypothetical protein C1645_824899 [Glomus cerebriforme]
MASEFKRVPYIDIYDVCKNYDFSSSDIDSNTDSESDLKADKDNDSKKTIIGNGAGKVVKDEDMNVTDSSEESDVSEDDSSEYSDSEDIDTSDDNGCEETDMTINVNENINGNANKKFITKVTDSSESDLSEDSDSDESDSSEDVDNDLSKSTNIEIDSDTDIDNDLDTEMNLEDDNVGTVPELTEDDDAGLHPEQSELLEKSEKIREFLKDDYLREIILEIDHAARNNDSNVESMLDNGRKNDEMFYNFTEEILNIIYGPPKMDF